MRSRIARTIVGVSAFVVVVLGIPLAVLFQRFLESRATIDLQREAAEAIAELTPPLTRASIAAIAGEPDAPADFSVYDPNGALILGSGPAHLGQPSPDRLVVVSPITDHATEHVLGSVMVSRPRAAIAAEARRAWAVMALAGIGGLALAGVVARREASRVAAPIVELAARAAHLGVDGVDLDTRPTGVAELDALTRALNLASVRLAELVTREREFTANASHQLRTPLAAMRVALERGDQRAAAAEADRLAAVVDHMLALARNSMPEPSVVDVATVVHGVTTRRRHEFDAAARPLVVAAPDTLPLVRGRATSLEQALEIVLDNSLQHGRGTTRVTVRDARGGVVVEVEDDGPGIDPDHAGSVFAAPSSTGAGRIGLPLARTLIESDGGRIVLADPRRAAFHLVFATDDDAAR